MPFMNDEPALSNLPDSAKENAASDPDAAHPPLKSGAKGKKASARKTPASPEGLALLVAVAERDAEEVARMSLLAPPEAILPALLRALALRRGPGARELGSIVDTLLAALPDPNAADENGRTPLMAAAAAGDTDLLQRLLPSSDPKASDHDGLTALMRAAHTGSLESVKALAGVSDVDAEDANGDTALSWAIASGAPDRALWIAKRANAGLHEAIELALGQATIFLEEAADDARAKAAQSQRAAEVLGGVKAPSPNARRAGAGEALRAPRGRPSSRLAMALASGSIPASAKPWLALAEAAGERAPVRGLATIIEGWGKALLPKTRARIEAASEERAAARAAKASGDDSNDTGAR
ncbi:Ankyrin [Burkholderia vietnamiensis G4]|uniref:Ankyrin n=1 Tax=Burkholderia vietnamiensis (strain G4 / LMG 22486) TaxID=269482 RepID=A4JFW4_BURVG|nr:Ankyrin [Burkholderia vietnamiensis G4]